MLVYTVVLAGGNLTMPLYDLWASQFGLGPVLFVYSGFAVPALLLGLIDQDAGTRISSTMPAALVICIALAGLALGRTV